jgi:hypothetical protein
MDVVGSLLQVPSDDVCAKELVITNTDSSDKIFPR